MLLGPLFGCLEVLLVKINELKCVEIELDNSESNTESEYQVNLQSELQESYDELENIKSMTNNKSVANMIIIIDLETIPHFKKNNLKQASAIANKIHPNVMSRRRKNLNVTPKCA